MFNLFKKKSTDKLISFLNSQEPIIEKCVAIHIGFFESSQGISFYVTGSTEAKEGSDEHTTQENFPLPPDRYFSMDKKLDFNPFEFVKNIGEQITIALRDNKLPAVYTQAKIITIGWDDGDLEYIKGN